MTCSRSHDKSRLDSVLVCVDCQREDAELLKRLADALVLADDYMEHAPSCLAVGDCRDSCNCGVIAAEIIVGKALAAARTAGVIA